MELQNFPIPYRMTLQLGDNHYMHNLYLIFMIMVSLAVVEYLIAMLTATIHVMYTEALSAEDAAQYFYDNPLAPASPAVWLVCGSCWHVLATTIFYWTTHQEGYIFLIAATLGAFVIGNTIREASNWAPSQPTGTLKKQATLKQQHEASKALDDRGAVEPAPEGSQL